LVLKGGKALKYTWIVSGLQFPGLPTHSFRGFQPTDCEAGASQGEVDGADGEGKALGMAA